MSDKSDLVLLGFASAATRHLSERDIYTLLQTARSNNMRAGITGVLLLADDQFFQLLEGHRPVVDRLFERIRADPRHRHVSKVVEETIAKRTFGGWTMGCASLTPLQVQRTDGMNDFFQSGRMLNAIKPGPVRDLLQDFRDGQWRARVAEVRYDG